MSNMNATIIERNELNVYTSEQFGSMRVTTIENHPWFVGVDVAKALGYRYPTPAIRDHVDNEDKQVLVCRQYASSKEVRNTSLTNSKEVQNTSLSNRAVRTTFVNESGLYSLILGSKLKSAKAFKRWVTSEVIPTISHTGEYKGTFKGDCVAKAEEKIPQPATIASTVIPVNASTVTITQTTFSEDNWAKMMRDFINKGIRRVSALTSLTEPQAYNSIYAKAYAYHKVDLIDRWAQNKERGIPQGSILSNATLDELKILVKLVAREVYAYPNTKELPYEKELSARKLGAQEMVYQQKVKDGPLLAYLSD